MLNKIFTAFCFFVAVFSLGYIFYMQRAKVPANNADKVAVEVEAKILAKKVDKNGIQHVIVEETNNVLPKNLLLSGDGYSDKFVDSLIEVTNIQRKQITSLMEINQTVQAKNLQAVTVIDSLHKKRYEYTDDNLYVSYAPSADTTKAGLFNYRFNQKIDVVQYNSKKWLFGQDRNMMDISANTPYSTINGVKKLTIPVEDNKVNFKLSSRSVFLPNSGNVATGVTMRIRYKKVTVSGSQLYFPRFHRWVPTVGIEYQLLNY